MKASKYIFRILLCSILIFSMLIGDAYSYQEAKTQTSENVYSVGDVSATLNNVELITHRDDNLVYPSQFFEVQPEIANTGTSDIWTILAIKVSAIDVPYANQQTLSNYESASSVIDNHTYIPSFYPIVPSRGYVWGKGYVDYWNIEGYSNLTFPLPPEEIQLNTAMAFKNNWTLLYIDERYSQTEGGFFIYYIGYSKKLKPNEVAPTPFDALLTANVTLSGFSESGYYEYSFDGVTSYDQLHNYNYYADTDIFDKNMTVSMKLFALQADYNEEATDIQSAYEYMLNKYSLFGNNTIISANIDAVADENNNLNAYVHTTDDVSYIVIKSESGYSSNIINTLNPDENGVISIHQELPFDTAHTNTHYYVEAYDADNNLVDTTEMGWVS